MNQRGLIGLAHGQLALIADDREILLGGDAAIDPHLLFPRVALPGHQDRDHLELGCLDVTATGDAGRRLHAGEREGRPVGDHDVVAGPAPEVRS